VLAEGNVVVVHFVGNMTLFWIQRQLTGQVRDLFDANADMGGGHAEKGRQRLTLGDLTFSGGMRGLSNLSLFLFLRVDDHVHSNNHKKRSGHDCTRHH
jgi:hypothetical protein